MKGRGENEDEGRDQDLLKEGGIEGEKKEEGIRICWKREREGKMKGGGYQDLLEEGGREGEIKGRIRIC